MKTLLAILIAAGLGCAAAYVVVSNRKTAEFQRERAQLQAKWEEEKHQLEREIKSARNQPARIEQVTETVQVAVTNTIPPQAILDRLLQMKPGSAESARYQSLRQIIHQLENLREAGPAAFPVIRNFLARNQDISYEREREGERNAPSSGTGSDRSPSPTAGFAMPRTDFYYPYSLRLGLFDVVRQIGGAPAEQILSETLVTTGRAVEVAHLDKLLDELAPGKYASVAISAAKELLAKPLFPDNPTRIDDSFKTYLYAILAKYKDTSFLPTARALLVSQNGQLDHFALAYVTKMEKDQAVPTLCQLYMDARLTNLTDKVTILNATVNYVGINAQANQLFADLVAHSSDQGGRERYLPFMVLSQLDHSDLAPTVIQSRLTLLNSLRTTVQDPRVLSMIDRVHQNLQRKLDPQSVPAPVPGLNPNRLAVPR